MCVFFLFIYLLSQLMVDRIDNRPMPVTICTNSCKAYTHVKTRPRICPRDAVLDGVRVNAREVGSLLVIVSFGLRLARSCDVPMHAVAPHSDMVRMQRKFTWFIS